MFLHYCNDSLFVSFGEREDSMSKVEAIKEILAEPNVLSDYTIDRLTQKILALDKKLDKREFFCVDKNCSLYVPGGIHNLKVHEKY